MSSYRIFIGLCLLCLGGLGACGFQPLYKTNTGVTQHYADINIPSIKDRDGQALRNNLIDRIYTHGRPADARYDLVIDPLKTDIAEMGIRKDATATREEIAISARVKLIDTVNNTIVLERSVRATGSHNILDSQYATLVTRQYIVDNILQDLSDAILTEIDLYFNRSGGAP